MYKKVVNPIRAVGLNILENSYFRIYCFTPMKTIIILTLYFKQNIFLSENLTNYLYDALPFLPYRQTVWPLDNETEHKQYLMCLCLI